METAEKIQLLEDLVSQEVQFLKEELGIDAKIFESKDGRHSVNLPYILQHYKEYLEALNTK